MADEPKIYQPGVAVVVPANDAPKSVDEITSRTAANYPSVGDTPQPRKRKPRSDIGKARKQMGLEKDSGEGQDLGGPSPSQAAAYTVDKQVVEKTAKAILHAVDGALVRKVQQTTIKLGGDKELAIELATSSGLTADEGNLMAELTGVIFEKHGLLTGYAPEILLGLMVSSWSVRVYLTMRRLNQLAEKAAKVKVHADSPQTDQDRH